MIIRLIFLSLSLTSSAISTQLLSPTSFYKQTISWQSPETSCPGPPQVYTILPSPGKGLGLFALHDLEIGTIIIREKPILAISRPSFEKGSGYPLPAISRLVRAEFARLTPTQQSQVSNLTFHAIDKEKEESDILGLIFRSNAYKTGERIGLFPRISRINHSCRPNTSYYWNEKLGVRVVFATKKIKKGEEISDSYISLLAPREERNGSLRPYGFVCGCHACVKGGKESDERRVEVKKAFGLLEGKLDMSLTKDRTEIMNAKENAWLSLRVIALLHQEELADYYANAYKFAAVFHSKIGDWATATKYANMGYEWRVMEDPESGLAMEMYELTSRCIEGWKAELRAKQLLKGDL
ncbi:hypothetical protein FKW77_000137 [Venturia effusa]|uniref:SET domain-containing protein n=1 Tax=Venturia effusa TaxID=50376 RepID=A0A517LA60_9PEZI|nr:hypothetical protein FKW77_000137 [Venturia effusa]